ncbi:2-C-methyl-D-erythritol 4-phosphate cytidylyltransferase [Alteromonas oceanisediminis]|uniref:2-C-methyl-D-erythritol 4-phosphate cytidylyltransferase n=1 Tax=Alteromonas oceanisediminis TaxID=2836180 RepID=UPI001BD9F4DE|nr:2-C-methyl-D-erythritol 4-phosphate cytidylyltransferase [Alteromonas oceanisediminis]MBT0585385.1 2-C-methyl-D-erythritol 4-phosphate cytidylyltransferase [Alteromonas oceanisediminis]
MSTLYPVVIPAAGIGKRMQASMPKQYLTIAGKTILQHTIETLDSHPRIGDIYVVISTDDTIFSGLTIAKQSNIQLVIGGDERVDSVLCGLRAVRDSQNSDQSNAESWVLVHDAARPCVRHEDISNLLALRSEPCAGGILASRVRDTMKRSQCSEAAVPVIERTEPREFLWHALTPQFFPLTQLIDAIEVGLEKGLSITDEASAMEAQGLDVALIESNASNIKITTPDDLALATFYLTQNKQQ